MFALKSGVRRTGRHAQRFVSFFGFGRRLSFVILLLAVTALVCFLAVQQQTPVGLVDLNAASEQQQTELAVADKASAFSTMASDILNNTLAEESVEEIPAIAGSWARELRQLKELAAEDPAAALTRASELSASEEREAALREVCIQISASNPALAMNAAWQYQLGKLGGMAEVTALENLASQWATTDLLAALTWTDQQPPDEAGQRDRVIKGIASTWSQHAPADAARLIAESMSPNYPQFDAAMNLVGQWATTDFPGASAWVQLFPEGPLQDRGREELSKAVSAQRQQFNPAGQ